MNKENGHGTSLSDEDFSQWMATLKARPQSPDDFISWVEGPLRAFFPFTKLICVYGELIAGEVKVTHFLATGFTSEQLARQTLPFETAQRGALAKWLLDRQPFYIDPQFPPEWATEFELSEMRELEMGVIAAHGVLNIKGNGGTYFSFAGVRSASEEWHLDALRILTPVLNDLFLEKVAATQIFENQLRLLTPQQKLIARKVAAGLDNKAIAKELGVSEKTVRNQLSHVFVTFNVKSRAELQAVLL